MKCKFCGCKNATEPINDDNGKSFKICVDCEIKTNWEKA